MTRLVSTETTRGPAGPPGDNGSNGSNGKSAYQVALDGGFVGTEAAWLASLKGDQGDPGPQGPATIAVGDVTTGAPGTEAVITNAGTAADVILDITIPRGNQGNPGTPGAAATLSVGSVTTVPNGTPADVDNSGTANAAVLDFVIPAGPKGDTGNTGPAAPLTAPSRTVTGDFTFQASDVGGIIIVNNGATAVVGTIPTAASVPQFAVVDDKLPMIRVVVKGSGSCTINPASGVNRTFRSSPVSAGQNAMMDVVALATNDWNVGGDTV